MKIYQNFLKLLLSNFTTYRFLCKILVGDLYVSKFKN